MTKITVTFKDGSRRALKSPFELRGIDKHRDALYVMDNGQVYSGRSDGEVDEEGDFCVKNSSHAMALPFGRLVGWCYRIEKR